MDAKVSTEESRRKPKTNSYVSLSDEKRAEIRKKQRGICNEYYPKRSWYSLQTEEKREQIRKKKKNGDLYYARKKSIITDVSSIQAEAHRSSLSLQKNMIVKKRKWINVNNRNNFVKKKYIDLNYASKKGKTIKFVPDQ